MVLPPLGVTVTVGVLVKTAVLPLLVMLLPLILYKAPLAPEIAMAAPAALAAARVMLLPPVI